MILPRGGCARTETRRRVYAVARAVMDVSWLELDRRRPGRADGARKRRTTKGDDGRLPVQSGAEWGQPPTRSPLVTCW